MDFSEFCESLEDPIYVGEEKVTCRKGFKYDKKLGKCVPEANTQTSHTQNPGSPNSLNLLVAGTPGAQLV